LHTTLHDVAHALAARTVSARELCDASLARVQAHDDLGAFLSVDVDGARAHADASDTRRARGEALGVLDGVPLALKDNIAQEGVPLTAGSKILQGFVSPYDATVTARLQAAGAVLVGKCNLDEFGMGSSTENSAFRVCKNPWDLTRTPGGSSGGSAAAVAAGLVVGALGTDTGGSIRQPAACCGLVGLKPTYGRVSRFGVVAYASSLDQVGPLARTVDDVTTLYAAIAGHDARDATSAPRVVGALTDTHSGVRGLRVGRVQLPEGARVHDDVTGALARTEAALVDAGAVLVDVQLPHTEDALAAYYVLAPAEASSNLSRYDGVRYGPRVHEERGLHAMVSDTRALFGDEVKTRVLLGTWVLSAGYYEAYTRTAQQVRRLVVQDFDAALSTCDVLLLPTMPTPAPRLGAHHDDALAMWLGDVFTIPASLAGLPALSLNAGFSTTPTGTTLPIGVQLVGRAWDEATVLRAAWSLEQALGLSQHRPR
jgi:aspartyl-tRNA(Asn)/glutamyl-tRNA(Gln) amidotransferase subunit A